MADKETQDTQEGTLKQMKLLLMIVLVIALVAPLLSTMMAVNTINKKIATIAVEDKGHEKEKKAHHEMQMAFYKPMQFLVNLGDVDANHYLRATLSIGAKLTEEDIKHAEEAAAAGGGGGHGGGGGDEHKPEPAVFKILHVQEPIIRDVVISVISNYTMDQLVATAGKQELKEVIKAKLREQLHTENIEVYFTAFTLQ